MARGKTGARGRTTASARQATAGGTSGATLELTQEGVSSTSLLSPGEFSKAEHSPQHQGMVLNLEGGNSVLVGSKIAGLSVGRYGMSGLDGVDQVTELEDGTILVTFRNGSSAIVNLEAMTIRTDAQGNPSPEATAALYEALAAKYKDDPKMAEMIAALAAYHADREDLASLAIAAAACEKAIADLDNFTIIREEGEPSDQESRLAAVRAAMAGRDNPLWLERLRQSLPGTMSVLGPIMYPNNAAIQREQMNLSSADWDEQDMRAAFDDLAARLDDPDIAAKAQKAKDKDALEKLAQEYSGEMKMGSPGPIALAARRRTARVLGLPLFESDPHYVVDGNIGELSLLINGDRFAGTRTFGLAGPPGTGKNTFIYELASTTGQPVVEVDFANGDSMRDLLGDVGLVDGSTVLREGTLAKGLCAPGGVIAVFNEVVSARSDEMTALHNIMGSKADQSTGRWITYKSPEGLDGGEATRREVDGESLMFLTWNPGRGDERLSGAVMRRMAAYTIEYGDEESETRKMCHVVYPVVAKLAEADPAKAAGWSYDPDLTEVDAKGDIIPVPIEVQCPELAKECRSAVRLAEQMRTQYYDDSIQHFMETTTLSRFISTIIMEDHFPPEDEGAATTNGVQLAARRLDFMFDQSRLPEDRWSSLTELMSSIYGERIDGSTGGIGR